MLVALMPIGGQALADAHVSAAQSDTGTAPATTAGSAVATIGADNAGSASGVTTGSIIQEPSFAQRMSECMEIWDRGTHMTKKQWRRSCQATLRSLKWD